MTDWASEFHAIVASDVGQRDGIGWEFTGADGLVWTVFREDGGPFPVLSSARGDGPLPSQVQLEAMTIEAVSDLLSPQLAGRHDWMVRNIAAALLFASRDVVSWEGVEWAVELDQAGEGTAWAEPGDLRTPYAWLRARSSDSDALVSIYQEDAYFGLSFADPLDRPLPASQVGGLRPCTRIDLARGRITAVEVVYDTTIDGLRDPGLLTEVLLHSETGITLLIAAEAYSREEWHLHDESVVALPSPAAADRLHWDGPRKPWHPSEGSYARHTRPV
ncbi:hypothetical protein [Cellulomonas sp. URHD0024]|uniref:hypothetical protein n=1 Tax=Cellulomonas sp. URHD0024 TaxID=1302620 RepID=UPI0012DCCE66|nr:hypothetical protein [Cellulomonas sp. URHD0024]